MHKSKNLHLINEFVFVIRYLLFLIILWRNKNDSRIKINYDQQHLLAYPYNEYISIAPYIDYKGESFSSIICNEICELRKSCTSFDDFYNNVVCMINNLLNELKNNQIKGSAKKIKVLKTIILIN